MMIVGHRGGSALAVQWHSDAGLEKPMVLLFFFVF